VTEEMSRSVTAGADTGQGIRLLDGVGVAGPAIAAGTVASVARATAMSARVVLNDHPRPIPECRLGPGESAWPDRPSGLSGLDSLPVTFPAEAPAPR
jgi:hypothetical protein